MPVHDADLAPLVNVPWPTLDHRVTRSRLDDLGWVSCGVGDWAYAHRSPGGRLVARVSPFEPAYGYFVELCQRCSGNRYVPRIDLTTRLAGGGHLAVLEYLSPADQTTVETFLQRWRAPDDADKELRTLRRQVDELDEWARHNVRWWGGVDIGDRHILLSVDGYPKLIDLFYVTWDLIKDLIRDPNAFAQHMPTDQCRYILDIPDLQDGDAPDYVRQIREALAVLAIE